MRNQRLIAVVAASFVFSAPSAFAQVVHPDVLGTNVDFKAITETTQSAGDPAELWGPPQLGGTGDQLLFFPTVFTSSCNPSIASDTTSSILTANLEAKAGMHIETVALVEAGDALLFNSIPFGDPSTNGSISMSGNVTVTETTGGPIAPVVIPFSGTFTPTDTFALPVNFGSSSWSGSMAVDVASVVPLATKATLELDNTLSTNCKPSQGIATVQKKVVSGPAVALLVNPLQCELQLDKTCCVTQPVLADLDACGDNDDVVSLTLEYTGDKCHNSDNDQGKAFRCWGRREVGEPATITVLDDASQISVTPNSGVNHGDEVVVTSSAGTLSDRLKLKVTDSWSRRQFVRIDTSCDRALQCDDQFGAFKVTGIQTAVNGVVDCNAPPPPPECVVSGDPAGTPCDGKLVDMVLEYNGQACQSPLPNPQNGEAECVGDATGATDVGLIYTGKFSNRQTVTPASGINDGDLIRVTATFQGGLFPNQEFKIVDAGGVRQTVAFHVSCSQPLALGDEFGSLKLVEFTTKTGFSAALGSGDPGPFDACEVPLAPPGPHCTSDLKELTLVYIGDFLGEGCTVSNSQDGQATCSGVADPGDPVSIIPGTSGLTVDPTSMVEFGDLVTISKGGADLGGTTTLIVMGAGGQQTLSLKTSCWEPLNLGDRFGSMVVFGLDREDEGTVSLGGNIQYQYAVTNPSLSDTVDNVSIDDDQLGTIVSGVSLAPGETQTFKQSATLFGTTTNVATATGDVNGDVCDPGIDVVNVDVLAPAPGAFSCSEPISEFTVIWNGAQTVDVKLWTHTPGSSVLLGTFDDVAPGAAIVADGLSGGYPSFEIFDSTGTTLLGTSRFDLTCRDKDMNGVEDCGKRVGDLKIDDPALTDDWLLEGMVDTDETLECTPGLVPQAPACGFGPELIVLMPGLLWWHRRRLHKE